MKIENGMDMLDALVLLDQLRFSRLSRWERADFGTHETGRAVSAPDWLDIVEQVERDLLYGEADISASEAA